ncbi:SDR family NAD(P)-dependent oxidoreductase [Motilibacter aurantiacus]|uniref:SDR family NAD(P)-dependent oxidoreductase n=1 Tax=Motilibacter aurantiacus TaxID=2714955 RepID=UPI00140E8F42|nr:SDR family NAD(P)-dependent oxidoreductase [Motilibacter aurantiacus]NHC46155.1 SDR family NAD(P)-dependent oxidoreductase [Motilibacter aurantiacus]
MARVLVTGSSDGLGLLAARLLAEQGHRVTLHARNDRRRDDAERALPEAEAVVVGDLSSLAETRDVAAQANGLGRYDAVIHNAAVGYQEQRRAQTEDGLAQVFAVNVLSAYLLTALVQRPDRLVYLGSGMHRGGDPDLSDLQWERKRWNGSQAYADSKLLDVVLALAVARRWPQVRSNAVDPGWVPTRMGGRGAPDDLRLGAVTQAWLAAGGSGELTGAYLHHQRRQQPHPAASDERVQEELLARCAQLTGVELPAP